MSKRKIFVLTCLFTSTLLLFTACHNTREPIQLSLNPTAGNVYLYRIVVDMSMTGIENGREQHLSNEMDLRIKMTAKESNDDEVQFEVAFQSLAIESSNLRTPWLDISINTEDFFDEDPATLSEEELEWYEIGKERIMTFLMPMTVTFVPDGSVRSIDMEEINNRINSWHSEEPGFVQAFLNENFIKEILEAMFRIFPNNEVRIGDNWSSGNRSPAFPDVTILNTLASISGNNALIGMSVPKIEEEIGSLEFSVDIKGEIEIDIHTGMIIQSNLEGKILFVDELGENKGEGVVRQAITLEQ